MLALLFNLVSSTPGTASVPEDPNPRIAADSNDPIGWVYVKGHAPTLPRAYASTHLVTIYLDRATITPGLHEVTLPLASMGVISARPSGLRWTRRKAVDATWVLEVTGPDVALTFRGPWLFLAQLATIATWPEPS